MLIFENCFAYYFQTWQLDSVRWRIFFLRNLIELTFVVYFSLKMSRYSVSERIFIVRTHYSNNSPIVTQRKFATEFKLKTTDPSMTTINIWKHWNFDSSVSDAEFRYSFAPHFSYRPAFKTCYNLQSVQKWPKF